MRITTAASAVIDGVGSSEGPVDVCREGVGLVLTGTGDRSFERRTGGTQDTDDNVADFVGPKAGDPQNFGAHAPPVASAADRRRSTGAPAHVSRSTSAPVDVTGRPSRPSG